VRWKFIPAAAGVASYNPTLEWKACTEIDLTDTNANLKYTVRLGLYNGTTSSLSGDNFLYEYPNISCTTGKCSLLIPNGLVEDKKYAWKVKTVDDGNLSSDWSQESWFEVNVDTAKDKEEQQAGGGAGSSNQNENSQDHGSADSEDLATQSANSATEVDYQPSAATEEKKSEIFETEPALLDTDQVEIESLGMLKMFRVSIL
jgi:hypothetical protein